MKEIKTIGVIGFGVMGAAIAINSATAGYKVIFKELNDELVQSMYDKWVEKALGKRVALEKMTQAEMDRIKGLITGTSNFEDLAPCDLVIEAAVENMDLKIEIFADLDKVLADDTIIVSNTSTYLIEQLMANVSNPQRTAGLHYFFPANVNRLVEVIRQKETSDDTYQALMAFAEKCKKVAITVKDSPGFAINPIFISSYLVLDSFYSDQYNVATLDSISREALGVKYGIMWVQNGSGIGTAYHAAKSMVDYLADTDIGFPALPAQVKTAYDNNQNWNLEDGPVSEDGDARKVVLERLLGALFAISSHLIEKEVVSVKDLELGICTALAWPKGPFSLMNDMGMAEAGRMVKLAVAAGDFKLPRKFATDSAEAWEL